MPVMNPVMTARTSFSPPKGVSSRDVFLDAQGPFDPLSIANGGKWAGDISVPGADLGDYAMASFSIPSPGVYTFVHVSAKDTVRIVYWNRSGATIDLGAGIARVRIIKHG